MGIFLEKQTGFLYFHVFTVSPDPPDRNCFSILMFYQSPIIWPVAVRSSHTIHLHQYDTSLLILQASSKCPKKHHSTEMVNYDWKGLEKSSGWMRWWRALSTDLLWAVVAVRKLFGRMAFWLTTSLHRSKENKWNYCQTKRTMNPNYVQLNTKPLGATYWTL